MTAIRDFAAPRRIVVTTDFSDAAGAVWPQAFWMAERFGAAIDVLHVVAQDWTHLSAEAATMSGPSYSEWLLEGATAQMEDWIPTDIPEGVTVTSAVREHASTVGGVVAYLDEKPADVVMMATHGRGFLGRLFLGSVARRLISDGAVPMWCVHVGKGRPRATFETPERVLVATDFSHASREAFLAAVSFAREIGAQVTLAHVIHVELPPVLDQNGVSVFMADHELEPRLLERLDAFVTASGVSHPDQIELAVLEGKPAQSLAAYANDEADIGLIALARRGAHRHPFGMGSTTDRLLHDTKVPVLLF